MCIRDSIVVDSFGTAANVTGDGAIAMVINKFAHGKIKGQSLDDATVTPSPAANS